MPKRTRTGEPVAYAPHRLHRSFAVGANNRTYDHGQGRGRGPQTGAPAHLKLDLYVSEAQEARGEGNRPGGQPHVAAVVQPPAQRTRGLGRIASRDLSLRLSLRVTNYGSYTCDVVDARWTEADEDSAVDMDAAAYTGRHRRPPLGPPRLRNPRRNVGLPLEQRVSWAPAAQMTQNDIRSGNGYEEDDEDAYDDDNKSYRRRRKRAKGQQPKAPPVERLPLLHMTSHYMMDDDNAPASQQTGAAIPATVTIPPPLPIPKPVREIIVKPKATNIMGGGKRGVWTATVFTPPAAFTGPASFFAPGMHTALPGMPPADAKMNPRDSRVIKVEGGDDGIGATRGASPSPSHYGNTLIVTTDGHVISRGASGRNAPAGWAFVYNPAPDGVVSGAIEEPDEEETARLTSGHREEQQQELGPGEGRNTNLQQQHRRRRVDVQALLEALVFRDWPNGSADSFAPVDRIVLVTSSYHTMKGATHWLREWAGRDWHTAHNHPVPNQDLWRRFSDALGRCARAGCEVSVWHVPRAELGNAVTEAAVEAAQRFAMTAGGGAVTATRRTVRT